VRGGHFSDYGIMAGKGGRKKCHRKKEKKFFTSQYCVPEPKRGGRYLRLLYCRQGEKEEKRGLSNQWKGEKKTSPFVRGTDSHRSFSRKKGEDAHL